MFMRKRNKRLIGQILLNGGFLSHHHIFNGQKSVLKKVEQGIVSFTPGSTASGDVAGVFDVVLVDYDSATVPPPQHHLKGMFNFRMGTYGPASPLYAAVL